ncbi:hypothetical protein C0Q70_02749 [Pomacea canaliculata]|uniref:Uncharacterized protein n=2 Tax=Pomacea canaliculata TaxID=400727 RepID=A0A2T7PQU2_POMCA|nr:hypothetical protein C0Q70_02749 [Pomacea canaliculata]
MYPDYKAKTANGTDGHRHCTAQSHVTKLSFNDYLLTWQSIATTKPRENIQNQLHQLQERYPQLQKIHLGLTKEEVQEQMKGQMEEYHQLMYGSFTRKVKDGKERSATLARIQQMRKIYLPPRHSSAAHEHSSEQLLDSGITTREGVDEWEKEVDDLVLWTDKLDAAAIDT